MRLQCDQKRPSCSTCLNTGRACPGYRDISGLVFRDEGRRFKAQVRAVAQPNIPGDDQETLAGGMTPTSDQQMLSPYLVAGTIQWAVEDTAINYMLGTFLQDSHFDYMPDLYASNTTSPLLNSILAAVGLSALSQQSSSSALGELAQRRYLTAVQQTNQKLQRPETANDDQVLASVLLLSLYETLKVRNDATFATWTTHVNGALALITLRGPGQLYNATGVRLFRQAVYGTWILSVSKCLRIPERLKEMIRLLQEASDAPDSGLDMAPIIDEYINLQIEAGDGLVDTARTVERGQRLLQIIDTFVSTLPPTHKPRIVRVGEPTPDVFGDYCLEYCSLGVLRSNNTIHMMRIGIHRTMALLATRAPDHARRPRSVSLPADAAAALLKTSHEGAVAACQAICAGVPGAFSPDPVRSGGGGGGAFARAYGLVWPLFVAGSCPMAPAAMKRYIVDRLMLMAATLKLPQARRAAAVLTRCEPEDDW